MSYMTSYNVARSIHQSLGEGAARGARGGGADAAGPHRYRRGRADWAAMAGGGVGIRPPTRGDERGSAIEARGVRRVRRALGLVERCRLTPG